MDAPESTANGESAGPQTGRPLEISAPSASPADAGAERKAGPWRPWRGEGYEPTDYSRFEEGKRSPFNVEIARIFGRGRDFLVYCDRAGRLAMHFNEPLPAYMRPALKEHRRLTAIAGVALSRLQREKARELIGAGLTHAFTAGTEKEAMDGMAPAKAFVESRAVDRARSNFLLIVTACAVMAFAALCFLKYRLLPADGPGYLRAILLGGMGGIVGAAISWVQRCGDVDINYYASRLHQTFHGAMRVMLGMVFGTVVVIVAESDFAFSIATRSSYALCLMALAAGFSERLVPDVISAFAQQQSATEPPPAP
jgi:hypothetical protein